MQSIEAKSQTMLVFSKLFRYLSGWTITLRRRSLGGGRDPYKVTLHPAVTKSNNTADHGLQLTKLLYPYLIGRGLGMPPHWTRILLAYSNP
jgi:hypothetical protein